MPSRPEGEILQDHDSPQSRVLRQHPHHTKYIDKLESAQRSAARSVTNQPHRRGEPVVSVTAMIQDLGWEPLSTRRLRSRLTSWQPWSRTLDGNPYQPGDSGVDWPRSTRYSTTTWRSHSPTTLSTRKTYKTPEATISVSRPTNPRLMPTSLASFHGQWSTGTSYRPRQFTQSPSRLSSWAETLHL